MLIPRTPVPVGGAGNREGDGDGSSSLSTWVVILVVLGSLFAISGIVGGIAYYAMRDRDPPYTVDDAVRDHEDAEMESSSPAWMQRV